jgi:hypothetical protein
MPPLSPKQGEPAAAVLGAVCPNEGAGASNNIPIICSDTAADHDAIEHFS